MSKVWIVYWSGTGNTEAMAQSVADGVREAGAEAVLTSVGDADPAQIAAHDRIAFGCPSMGDEVLEEGEFEPFFAQVEDQLSDKKVALFGSYDWGDGRWMRDWQQRLKANTLVDGEGLIVNLTPDEEGLAGCKALGKSLVQA